MGKVYPEITDSIQAWVKQQSMFFVSTAPLAGDGLINCSPKGLDSFRILGPNQVAYLDLTGSGVETIAHVRENGRIIIMFCAFNGSPNIVRFHGRGRAVLPEASEFSELVKHFLPVAGIRSIILVDVMRISDSCGYGVPKYEFLEHRDTLVRWAESKGQGGVQDYQTQNNLSSLDGLPGLSQTVD